MPPDLVASIPANILNTQRIEFFTDGTKKARSYAGHVHVDGEKHERHERHERHEKYKNHLFYWFFESQTCNPHLPAVLGRFRERHLAERGRHGAGDRKAGA